MLSHFSCIWLCVTLWTVACQVPLSMRFSRQEYWNGLPCPPPGDRPDPGIEPMSLFSPALAGGFFTTSTTWEAPEDTDHSYYMGKAAAALPRSLLIPWISSELPCLLTLLCPPPPPASAYFIANRHHPRPQPIHKCMTNQCFLAPKWDKLWSVNYTPELPVGSYMFIALAPFFMLSCILLGAVL